MVEKAQEKVVVPAVTKKELNRFEPHLGPQRGVIVFGGGLNARNWIDDARTRGFIPVL